MRQLHDIGKKKEEWERLNAAVLAVSSAAAGEERRGAEAIRRIAGPAAVRPTDYANARRFHSYDDFEEIELHSTILIDKQRPRPLGAFRRRSVLQHGVHRETARPHE